MKMLTMTNPTMAIQVVTALAVKIPAVTALTVTTKIHP
jgi:hypothetical protein